MIITQKKLFQVALYTNAFYVFLLFMFKPNGINLEKIIISVFLLVSVISMLLLVTINIKALKEIPKTGRYIFWVLFFWSLIVIARGFTLNIQDWITNFGNVYMALAWFVPCVLILGKKIELWNMVFKAMLFMFYIMIFAFLTLTFQNVKGTEWTWLLRPINFVLLLGVFRKSLINNITVVLILYIYIVVAIKLKQRVEFIFLFFVFFFIGIEKLKHVRMKKSILRYILFGFAILLCLIFTFGYENISNIVSNIVHFQDSRTFLFKELFADLSPSEKIFGRGSLGTYYSAFFEDTRKYWEYMGRTGWAGDVPDRITTEVGYLQMILKGGFLLLTLTVFIMLYAAYLGIFKSKSKFIKRLGLFILIISIISIISFRPAFTPTFIILWLAVGTVLNKQNRQLNDEEIQTLIKFR